MPPLYKNDSSSKVAWVRQCAESLRESNLAALAELLEQELEPAMAPYVTFYRARLELGNADFDKAVQIFRQAHKEAVVDGYTVLQQHCLVWEAYAECHRGHYERAQELVNSAERLVSTDDVLYGEICFVRGLITSEQDSLLSAQSWMRKAYNLAISFQDEWMQARCCANLAAIYSSQGRLNLAAKMIWRVEQINSSPNHPPNNQQLTQVRNIHMYNLRWRGEPEQALQFAESLSSADRHDSKLFAGYLALTTAMIQTDVGDFTHAEKLWETANTLLNDVTDDQRTRAELFWERAWLHLRKGDLESAYQDIQKALNLIDDDMETECYHAYVVAAIIDIRRFTTVQKICAKT